MKNTLIIYSGGYDSTVLLHSLKNVIAAAITFQYGSKHNKRELHFAKRNCKQLGIEHIVINLPLDKYLDSALLKQGAAIPNGHYEDKVMKKTVVPFRNGIMLSIAIAIAESRKLKYVGIANHSGDHAIYPDCRQEFIEAMGHAAMFGTYRNIEILSPFVNHTKTDIACMGSFYKVDERETYSCYKGGINHCGVCGTCVERREALRDYKDRTFYSQIKPNKNNAKSRRKSL